MNQIAIVYKINQKDLQEITNNLKTNKLVEFLAVPN